MGKLISLIFNGGPKDVDHKIFQGVVCKLAPWNFLHMPLERDNYMAP